MNYLKFHRLKLGKTQDQIARAAGISQGAYCSYEKGYKKPHPSTHKKLAHALERPPEEFTGLLYGIDPREMVAAAGAR